MLFRTCNACLLPASPGHQPQHWNIARIECLQNWDTVHHYLQQQLQDIISSDEMLWAMDRLTDLCAGEKRYISHVRISIEILKTTTVGVVWQRGYVEPWKCWLSRIWRFGVWTLSLHWPGSKVLSKTENFWLIPGQREVNRATWRRDCFQPTTDDISRYFGRRTTAAEAGRIWIDGSHH